MDISIKLPFEQLLGIIKNLNPKEKEEDGDDEEIPQPANIVFLDK